MNVNKWDIGKWPFTKCVLYQIYYQQVCTHECVVPHSLLVVYSTALLNHGKFTVTDECMDLVGTGIVLFFIDIIVGFWSTQNTCCSSYHRMLSIYFCQMLVFFKNSIMGSLWDVIKIRRFDLQLQKFTHHWTTNIIIELLTLSLKY